MKSLRDRIERWAQQLQRERLARDWEYRERSARFQQSRAGFARGLSKPEAEAFLDLMDERAGLQEQEEFLLFWLGLELGITLGAGDALDAGEDSGWGGR